MVLPPFSTARIKIAREPEGLGALNNNYLLVYEVELHRGDVFRPEKVVILVTVSEALLRGLREPPLVVAAYVRYWLATNSRSLPGKDRFELTLTAEDREFLECVEPSAMAKIVDTVIPIVPTELES
jgi:hypothetical protein